MISEEEALAAVLEKVRPLSPRKEALLDSLGHFAAGDVWAQRPLPPFDNSAMDGYAVQSASCRAGAKLRVTGEQPAGADRCLTIQAGEAIRIFTGAPMPGGADAVIMQEDVTREGAAMVAQCDVAPGEFVRPKGADLAEGQRILARGEPIAAQTLALLASQGIRDTNSRLLAPRRGPARFSKATRSCYTPSRAPREQKWRWSSIVRMISTS
jgi:molybdopterin molybdotransferase